MTARVGYLPDTIGITRPRPGDSWHVHRVSIQSGIIWVAAVPTEGSCCVLPPHSLLQNCSLKEVGTKGTLVIEAPECQEGLGCTECCLRGVSTIL